MDKKRLLIIAASVAVGAAVIWGGIELYRHTFKPADMGNPFFTGWETPFGVPPFDRLKAEHFKPAFEEAMRRQRAEIDSITANPEPPTFDNTIAAYDRSGELFKSVNNTFTGLTSAETNDELEAIKAEITPKISQHSDAIAMDSTLFARVRTVYDGRDHLTLNPAQKRLTEKVYQRFVRGGAMLTAAQKAELQAINGELSSLGVQFDQNHRGAVNAYRLVIEDNTDVNLPANITEPARERAGAEGLKDKLVFTLSKPSWIPFLTYFPDEEQRRRIYQAWLGQCADSTEFDNTGIINDIVRLRGRKANLLGFKSFADFTLDERMAKTPAKVYEFLDELWAPALEKAIEERDELQALKRSETGDSTAVLNSWDWWYFAEKVRKNRYSFDEEQARPYFSLDNVRNGVFKLCNRLYGISFRPLAVPVYHKDVVVYEVLDVDNSHLGVVYMDFFPRPGKGSGAWCSSYRHQGYDRNGTRISPVTTIVCNFTAPVGGTPALLTLDETETFFHEFGHALHNLFADVPYHGLLGVERDFVELPSQIMENWAFAPEMLAQYAIHYRGGEPIPDRIVRRMAQSSQFNQGFATTELLAAALSDMDIHSMAEYKPFDVAEFEKNALAVRRGLIQQIEPRYRYPYFSHIFDGGYSAGYYSYIWAEVLDKDAYAAFVETGDIFNRNVAEDFRRKVLAPRGMKDGMELYLDFRGAEPSREALFRDRGLRSPALAAADSLAALNMTPFGDHSTKPRQAPPDSVLRVILGEGPLEE